MDGFFTNSTITPDECRNGIKNLMVEYLGIAWARPNVLEPYGHLSKVPDADLPALYARAQADAVAPAEARDRADAAALALENAIEAGEATRCPTCGHTLT